MSLIKISAGNDQYWLLDDVPHQRGQFDISAKIGQEVVEIFNLSTLKSVARGNFDDFSPDGTTPYASTQALIDDLKTFFFRSLAGGGGGGAVDSVNGQTGTVLLDKSDIGLGNVDNVQQIPLIEKGANDGVATLDSSGKIPSSQLPNGLEGGITVVGFWNADTNTPNLSSITASQGEAYQVSVAGTTSLNGENNWSVRDLVVWSDSLTGNWFKINSTDAVLSVNGESGAVVLDADDISDTGTSNKWASQSELDQIATNTTNIADNATNITDNTSDIATNTGNIATNTSNIANNTANILTNTNALTTKLESITAGTPNVSITGDALNPVISVSQTTAGILQNVYFTADEVTTTEGTFYEVKINDRGTATDPSTPNTVQLDDNQSGAFAVDFLGDVAVEETTIFEGVYTGFPIAQVNIGQSNQRFKIEVYLCDGQGLPIAGIGAGDVGTLGVNTILIADSGEIDLQPNNPTSILCSGFLETSVTWAIGRRFRYRVVAEKVGTGGGVKTFTLFSGSDYNSFFQIPASGTGGSGAGAYQTDSITLQGWNVNQEYTRPHSLGAKPDWSKIVFVCTSPDNGYNTGDELDISTALQQTLGTGSQAGINIMYNDTGVYIRFANNFVRFLNSIRSGVSNLNSSNWDLKIDLYKGGVSEIVDGNAVHVNADDEINQLTEKVTAVSDDIVIIEDSEDSFNKKKVKLNNIVTGGVTLLSATVNITQTSWSGNTNYVYNVSITGAQVDDSCFLRPNAATYNSILAVGAAWDGFAFCLSPGIVTVVCRVSSFVNLSPLADFTVKIIK